MPKCKPLTQRAREIERRRICLRTLRASRGIDSDRELGRRIGLCGDNNSSMCKRMTGAVDYSMTELQAIISTLRLTDDEIVTLMRAAK